MGPHLHRLPGPLGQQAGGHQTAHGLLQRIVIALLTAPGVLGAHRRGQRLQDGGDHRGAFGGQVPGDDPGAGERRLHPELAVLEVRFRVVAGLGQGAGVDLGGQRGQVVPAGPGPGGGEQDVVGRGPAVPGKLVGPLADQPGHRRRHHGALGQRHQHLRMGDRAAGPAQVPAGGALGDAGTVNQPRGRAVVSIVGVTLAGGERAEDPGPGGGLDRVQLLEGLQALRLGFGGQGGGVGGG